MHRTNFNMYDRSWGAKTDKALFGVAAVVLVAASSAHQQQLALKAQRAAKGIRVPVGTNTAPWPDVGRAVMIYNHRKIVRYCRRQVERKPVYSEQDRKTR